jgi:hypothetical protein
MMPKLHEILAAEKTVAAAWNTLHAETLKKLGNEQFFNGHTKSLKMLEDSPANEAIEAQAREDKQMQTNVHDTLDYALGIFAKAENLQAAKNVTNTFAKADVVFRGTTLFTSLPVDQLLGLESRLGKMRELMLAMPTLDAARAWQRDGTTGHWVAPPEHGVKTEKIVGAVELSPATDKHPAQVEKVTRDVPVGKVTLVRRSGTATAVQKAEAIKLIDELLVEVKQARMRANMTEVVSDYRVGDTLKDLILGVFKD